MCLGVDRKGTQYCVSIEMDGVVAVSPPESAVPATRPGVFELLRALSQGGVAIELINDWSGTVQDDGARLTREFKDALDRSGGGLVALRDDRDLDLEAAWHGESPTTLVCVTADPQRAVRLVRNGLQAIVFSDVPRLRRELVLRGLLPGPAPQIHPPS